MLADTAFETVSSFYAILHTIPASSLWIMPSTILSTFVILIPPVIIFQTGISPTRTAGDNPSLCGAADRTRTGTLAKQILSLPCLPFHHSGFLYLALQALFSHLAIRHRPLAPWSLGFIACSWIHTSYPFTHARCLPIFIAAAHISRFWCYRRYLNPHDQCQRILSPLCLPFHHSSVYEAGVSASLVT